MSNEINIAYNQEMLSRLSREDPEKNRETSVVTSPGARTAAWAVKIKSLSSYNLYNVCAVVIDDAGSLPVEIGGQMQAFNLAESFLEDGQLPAGTFVLMLKIGEKNIFYAPV